MIGGESDQIWNSCFLAEEGTKRLKDKGHAFSNKTLCLKDAGHSVANVPGFSTTELTMVHPHMGKRIYFGGTPEGDAAGQRQAWDETVAFLSGALAAAPKP